MEPLRPDLTVRQDLSVQAKQTFQIVAMLATVLVVGIHYKSDVPDFPSPSDTTWNELAQEFAFGGLGRVAVPLFAFAAGFFYFRSDDGTLACYQKKLRQRARTILLPFFIVGSVAMTCWLLVRQIEGNPVQLSTSEFLVTWILRPPAEQLWFLRDLIVLVTLAPVIRWICHHRIIKYVAITLVAACWALNFQLFPMVSTWHLLHMETLLFFMLGCVAVQNMHWIERAGNVSNGMFVMAWMIWVDLVIARIFLRANFDIWYATDYAMTDLLLHQLSILFGSVTLFMTAWRIRNEFLIRVAGASFFVYLVHEFPLRAVIERFADRFLDQNTACWIVTPIVLIGCYATGMVLSKHFPAAISLLTGGRTPSSAAKKSTHSPNTGRAAAV